MTVVVCVSNNGGMLFNKRRQSKDRLLIENLYLLAEGATIYTNVFSSVLFEKSNAAFVAVENPLDKASEGDFVFCENFSLKAYEHKITDLVIYKWNRDYPADTYLDISPEQVGMSLTQTIDFQGSSHEKITREIWSKVPIM